MNKETKKQIIKIPKGVFCTAEENSSTQSQTSAEEESERHISKLERYIEISEANDPHLGDVLVTAGFAYLQGLYHASIDKNKALQYFQKANQLGCVSALYALGYYYVLFDDGEFFDGDEILSFGMGVSYLGKAHLAGNDNATNLLNDMIKDGMFPSSLNFNSIEDIIKFLDE